VLVLNKSLVPVDMTSVRRAFCLVFKALAQIVDVADGRFELYGFQSWQEISELKRREGLFDEHTEWVSTVSYQIEVPRVIRLLFYDHYPDHGAALNRKNLFARDENRCQYCGRRRPTSELSIDHVIPVAKGGGTTWGNVVCCCTECNKLKGGRTPEQAGMELVRRPFEPIRNPMIKLKLRRRKYYCWKHFLDEAYWSVTLR
jgi:5-methylcytosine-specific restriction endonuclease McrA